MARYLRENAGVKIMASAINWKEMERLASGGGQTPASWAALVPEHDQDIADRQAFKLGRATLTFYITPGHTPGTVSTVFEVTDGRARHTVGFFGGLGSPETREAKLQLIDSLEGFKAVVNERNIDVLIANHQTQDQSDPEARGTASAQGRRSESLRARQEPLSAVPVDPAGMHATSRWLGRGENAVPARAIFGRLLRRRRNFGLLSLGRYTR